MRRIVLNVLFIGLVLIASGSPGQAETFEKTIPFQIGEWIDIELEDGPAELHRMRIVADDGGLTKSKLFRPGNDEYLDTIQLQVEYSNSASRDWEADMEIEWQDSKGVAIDGYNDSESMDDDERHDLITVTLSTLSYGLARAKKLKIRFEIYPD